MKKNKITKIYTEKLKREFKIQKKSIQNKIQSKMKSKSNVDPFMHQLVKELNGILRTFLRRDEIPPSSLVQSKKRCLVGG